MIIDKVDANLLKKLRDGWNGTTTELADSLTISEETVQKRMQRLEKAGIVLYYDISLTPWIHGGEWIWAEAFITLQNPLFKYKVIESLRAQLEYFESATTQTVIPSGSAPDILVLFHTRSGKEYERELQKLRDMKDTVEVDTIIQEHMTVPRMELDDVDWRIFGSLKHDAKKTLKDLSKQTGVEPEEIERRLKRLIVAKKLFFNTATDFSRIDNWAHIHVKVTFQRELSQEDVAGLVAEGIAPPHGDWKKWGIERGMLTIEPWNSRELIEKTNKILQCGMKIQSLAIEDRYLPSQPWLDKLLESKGISPQSAKR